MLLCTERTRCSQHSSLFKLLWHFCSQPASWWHWPSLMYLFFSLFFSFLLEANKVVNTNANSNTEIMQPCSGSHLMAQKELIFTYLDYFQIKHKLKKNYYRESSKLSHSSLRNWWNLVPWLNTMSCFTPSFQCAGNTKTYNQCFLFALSSQNGWGNLKSFSLILHSVSLSFSLRLCKLSGGVFT